jgi:hypothetical protein
MSDEPQDVREWYVMMASPRHIIEKCRRPTIHAISLGGLPPPSRGNHYRKLEERNAVSGFAPRRQRRCVGLRTHAILQNSLTLLLPDNDRRAPVGPGRRAIS